MLEVTVRLATVAPAGMAPVEEVSVRIPGAPAEAGEGTSHELSLAADQGMAPVPVFWTETVTGAGDEPVGLKRYGLDGVTPMTAVGTEETVKVTGTGMGEPLDGVSVTVPE